MQQPGATFLGYLARDIVSLDAYLARVPERRKRAMGIDELCSVSGCISEAYRDYTSWRFNESGFYVTPEAAMEAVPAGERLAARVFAYRMFPCVFEGELVREVPVMELMNAELGDLPTGSAFPAFRSLGYDVVSFRRAAGQVMFAFDCSPLSCCHCNETHRVNRHWLIDSWDAAVEAAREFARTEPEPGRYCIVEVLEGAR